MAFTRILAPTDLSVPANHALRYAFEEAASHGAALTLLYVLPPEATTDVQYVHGAPEARGGLEEVAFGHAGFDPESGSAFPMPHGHAPESVSRPIEDETLDKLRDQVPDGFAGTWEAKVIPGKVADVLVQTADAQGADLIVMGTHGRTGLSHTLFGSVAEVVLRHASCPVLMVRYDHKPTDR